MVSTLDSAVQGLRAAAAARDAVALQGSAVDYLKARPLPTGRLYSSPLGYSEIGAILLTGQGSGWASRLARRLYFQPSRSEREVLLVSLPDAELRAANLRDLFHLRLLSGQWISLPKARGSLSSASRAATRRDDALLTALKTHDAQRLQRVIRAMVRADARGFSLLGYALYRLARQEKITVKVPRAYDF